MALKQSSAPRLKATLSRMISHRSADMWCVLQQLAPPGVANLHHWVVDGRAVQRLLSTLYPLYGFFLMYLSEYSDCHVSCVYGTMLGFL